MASTNKTELGLCLWVGTDHVKRLDFVEDNLLLDSLIKTLQEGKSDIGHGHIDLATNEKVKKEYINALAPLSAVDPNNTDGNFIITKHANCPNAEDYFYILNLYKDNKTGNRAQIAITYGQAVTTIYTRVKTTDWQAWQEVLTKNSIKKEHVGLGDVENYKIATKLEAEEGATNSKYMSPLRSREGLIKYLKYNGYLNRQSIDIDFNNLTTPGWYVNSSTLNAPSGHNRFAVLVMDSEGLGNYNNVVQMAFERRQSDGYYYRIRLAGEWKNWVKIGFYSTLKQQVQLKKTVTVRANSWVHNGALDNWEATISDSRIKATDNVDVNVKIEYAHILEDAGARGATKELDEAVKIYAHDKPASDVVVDININREVV